MFKVVPKKKKRGRLHVSVQVILSKTGVKILSALDISVQLAITNIYT